MVGSVVLLLAGCERLDTGPAIASPRRSAPPARHDLQRASPPVPTTVRAIDLGRSVKGRPLTLHVFGYGPDRVFIFGGIHGSEPTSAVLAQQFLDHLRDHPEVASGHTVAILAGANPDGLHRKRRTNANGVDLNRNFPAKNWRQSRGDAHGHGSAPASEPETRAIMRAVALIDPNRIISIHSCRRGHHCNNYDGPARHLAERMGSRNGYPAKASMGYPTPGSFGSWAGIDRGIPTITLELPRHLGGKQCWQENADALLAFLQGGQTAGR